MANAAPIVIILCVIVFFFVVLLAGLRLWEQKQIARREASLTVANTFKIRSGKKRRRFSTTEYHDYGDDAKPAVQEEGDKKENLENMSAETIKTAKEDRIESKKEQNSSLESGAEALPSEETSEIQQSKPNNLMYSIDIV